MTYPKINSVTWPYFQKFLKFHNMEFTPVCPGPGIWGGDQQKISGYREYNFLIDINLCLSSYPSSLVRDRTNSIKFPFLTESAATWSIPDQAPDLETCFSNRVTSLESQYPVVNLLWSGGIDSTAMVVAWLKFSRGHSKIRILYTLDSIKENIEFFLHLKTIKLKQIELIDMGGSVYYNNEFDGVEISGGEGDDITASVDQSFFKKYQWCNLQSSWRDFFWKQNPDQNFIDFCEKWFALSGRDITTVLHARWWFYLNKMRPNYRSAIVNTTNNIESFFNDPLFTAHFYHNIDSLFGSTAWNSYKHTIKDFIYEYHPDSDYRDYKCKENSGGYKIFANKSKLLKKTEHICILSNGDSIYTDNLPFLSKFEYRKKYGNQLDYLFTRDI